MRETDKTHSSSSSCLFLFRCNQFPWGLSERCGVRVICIESLGGNEVELWIDHEGVQCWYSHVRNTITIKPSTSKTRSAGKSATAVPDAPGA